MIAKRSILDTASEEEHGGWVVVYYSIGILMAAHT
jgi:hypothetical protein